jgi:Family of unknown function (DUF6132)
MRYCSFLRKTDQMKKYLKLTLYGLIGAVAGYAYYYFIGCSNGGSCPLTSNWYVTTLYGTAAGIVMGLPKKAVTDADIDRK